MRHQGQEKGDRWSVILAGGEGERTRPFIEQWLGYHKPKQYCSFVGNRSMLQHTWDRADQLTHPKQKVTVIAQNHFPEVLAQSENRTSGRVIGQPYNYDTAAGIFLPLTYIRAQNPQATAVLYPADHFVFPEHRFVRMVGKLIRAAELFSERLMLLGVSPTGVESDYGWIEPTQSLGWIRGSQVHQVGAFLEKPDSHRAMAAIDAGALWNTLIMAVKVETLWSLGWQWMPEVMERFEQLGKVIGTSQEGSMLREIYQDMPRRNFSSDLLGCATESVGVVELKDVLWSDWGRPERIAETLKAIGETPAFALEHMTEPRRALGNKHLLEVS